MATGQEWHGFEYTPGPIDVEGAVFDDFRLTDHLPPEQAPATIERDRLYMAARPGFNRKLLPLRVEPDTGTAYSGGRYLLDTYENAREFARWVAEDFAIDGTLILERPDFADVTAHVWHVIGAHDFQDLARAQKVYRTESWKVDGSAERQLQQRWPALRDTAEERGLAALWLLHNGGRGEAALVTIADSLPRPAGERGPDFASLRALEEAPSLLASPRSGMEKFFDRTSWVFTIWFPYRQGEVNRSPLWPNSPPLPRSAGGMESAA